MIYTLNFITIFVLSILYLIITYWSYISEHKVALCGVLFWGVIIVGLRIHALEFNGDDIRQRAVEKGYAKYSEKTGEFKWIDEDVQYVIKGESKND